MDEEDEKVKEKKKHGKEEKHKKTDRKGENFK